jgi:hypothetical protein
MANWAVAAASVITVAIVVALRFGASSQTETVDIRPPVTLEAPASPSSPSLPSRPTVTTSLAKPPAPVEPSTVPASTVDPMPERGADKREPPAVSAAVARPVEPAHSVAPDRAPDRAPERAAVAPPPPVVPPPPAPVTEAGEFDRAAARAALARAASAAASCKQADDPVGGGKVSVTFAPSGRVTSARIMGAPFQGTRIGGCIAATFHAVSVPPFTGDPVVVTKDVGIR